MKILYGVVGEGMGHAMRSRVVLDHLFAEGHEVVIMASSRAVEYLERFFDEVHRIHGLHIIYEENRVRMDRTIFSNALAGNEALPDQIGAYFDLVNEFDPEVVVSDFESWTYLFGQLHGLPILSIDNMQIINRCSHEPAIVGDEEASFAVTRAFIKGKLPFCEHYFITTFFYPQVRRERTSLHPPILRREILDARSERGDHLLVYQTAEGHDALVHALEAAGMPCRVYGLRRHITEDQVQGDLVFRPFSESVFIDDLRTARAVIAGGGFTLMGECVYLKKPMLCVPVGGQFEQVLNARYLEHLGFGKMAREVDADEVKGFVKLIGPCERALSAYAQDGNADLFRALDEELDRIVAGL